MTGNLTNPFTFTGQINNRDELIKQLGLSADVTVQNLLEAAFIRWSMDFNRYVGGDYVLILPLPRISDSQPKQLFCCLSAFSSYNLFSQSHNNQLKLHTRLDAFNESAEVDPMAMAQLLDNGVIIAPQTLFSGVSQLANGESKLWELTSEPTCISKEKLTLEQKIYASASLESFSPEPASPESASPEPIKSSTLPKATFNQLPQLSQILNQPVSATWQVLFNQQVANNSAEHILCDNGSKQLTALCQSERQETLNHSGIKQIDVAIKLTRPLLNTARKQNNRQITQLKQRYQKEIDSFKGHNKPDFAQWFALSYQLPARWAQKRQMAEHHGRTITFSCTNSAYIRQVLAKNSNSSQTEIKSEEVFAFTDASIINLYDAMQRLMGSGFKPVTLKLFNIITPYSANIFKLHQQHSERVNSFCYQTLTLDYLSRHLGWAVK
jgi:hypothetical protein